MKCSFFKPIYDALLAIQAGWGEGISALAAQDFETSQKVRAVDLSIRSMKLGGVGLPDGPEKERFNEIKMRLASLSTTFSNNILDETKAFSHTVEDPALVNGVPDSAKAMWAASHRAALVKEQGSEEGIPPMDADKGPWRITLDMPSYLGKILSLR
jgi:oligopeptidase A